MKKKMIIASVLCVVISAYFLLFRKTEIIFVHHVIGETDIVVRNFPLTQVGKIIWWENNKDYIKDKYNLPSVDNKGNYSVAILNESDGFKKNTEANYYWFSFEHTDLLCFEKINSENRCIEKNLLMIIQNGRDNKTHYYIDGDPITK